MPRPGASFCGDGVETTDREIGTVHKIRFDDNTGAMKHVDVKLGSRLQHGSTVVLQNSLKEDSGLAVSDALWNSKLTMASAAGDIPLQSTHRYSGVLTHTVEGTAHSIKQLINDPKYKQKLGGNGREHLKGDF